MVKKGKASGTHQLRAMAGLCNAAEFDAATMELPIYERTVYGDATDQAILKFSEHLGPVSELRQLWKKTYELAFNSKNKFMIRTFSLATTKGVGLEVSRPRRSTSNSMTRKFELSSLTVVSTNRWPHRLLTIKGAPEILIERCSHFIDPEGNVQTLDIHSLGLVKDIKDRWSANGKRVILLARKVLTAKDVMSHTSSREFESEVLRHVKGGLILVGLVGIVDPPREEIPSVIETLRRAGIRIFMVSYCVESARKSCFNIHMFCRLPETSG